MIAEATMLARSSKNSNPSPRIPTQSNIWSFILYLEWWTNLKTGGENSVTCCVIPHGGRNWKRLAWGWYMSAIVRMICVIWKRTSGKACPVHSLQDYLRIPGFVSIIPYLIMSLHYSEHFVFQKRTLVAYSISRHARGAVIANIPYKVMWYLSAATDNVIMDEAHADEKLDHEELISIRRQQPQTKWQSDSWWKRESTHNIVHHLPKNQSSRYEPKRPVS